ncbi:MAG TPA: tRNA (adenosine(37)-N6)-threonylcarbamoyltransferase complex dimerization subunit type 1 TsaB [Verrucomicrobiae bacterium]|jgi:tRNA threonylcarbamoyl adenosine modification protein YeaZ|nr:tRNA (adenosine(37)-N6)-threonylcarbamoyltransferase complex dimerization subunit type 1 TsaB [Verrucomicrobiae bacterium]
MKILAIEFSSRQRSVSALAGDRVLSEAMETAARATPAFELIARALAEARLEREDVECLAIGLGPGSYTGIRFAIALAQGWQLARPGVKLLGISSADCLAAEARHRGWFGTINVAIDAQRGELYLARYEIGESVFELIEPLKIAKMEEARSRVRAGETMVGPEADRWFENGRVLFPGAAMLGRLASSREDFVPGNKLEPIYLRETNFVKAPPPRVLPVK